MKNEIGKCVCIHNPDGFNFETGKTYGWSRIIDGIIVADNDGKIFGIDEIRFCWFFKKTEK